MIKLNEMYCFLHMEIYFNETFFAKLCYAIIIVHMSRCCRNINAKCAEHCPSDPRSTCSTLTSSASTTGQCYVALDRPCPSSCPQHCDVYLRNAFLRIRHSQQHRLGRGPVGGWGHQAQLCTGCILEHHQLDILNTKLVWCWSKVKC